MNALEQAIADAIADPDVTWFDIGYSWRGLTGSLPRRDSGPGSWSATVGGEVDGEEWDSGEVNGGEGAETLNRARLTEVPA